MHRLNGIHSGIMLYRECNLRFHKCFVLFGPRQAGRSTLVRSTLPGGAPTAGDRLAGLWEWSG